MKFTDITAYLLATGAVVILGVILNFAIKLFLEHIKKSTDLLLQLKAHKKDLEDQEEIIKEKVAEKLSLSYLEGRVDELSKMVVGMYPDIIDKVKDESAGGVRLLQLRVKQEVERYMSEQVSSSDEEK